MPTKYPEKGRSKMHAHHKMWKVAGKMMLHTTRDGKRRKSILRLSNNSKKIKTTVALATKEATMTQKCRTSKSHHNNNVVDRGNRTHHTRVVIRGQTSNTIGRGETTAK
jgi:hypothetical protein